MTLRALLHRLRSSRFARDDSGTSTVEFVIIFPIFMTIFFASFETGLLMVRNAMLERSTDLAVRELRLGTPEPPTFDEFKAQICENTFFIENCTDRVQVQLRPVSMTTWGPLEGAPRCRDLESVIDPFDQTEYSVGANNELMMVRVCVLFRPVFPGVGHGLALQYEGSGSYAMVATSAFVNEPSR